MDPGRYYELTEAIKQAVAIHLSVFRVEGGKTEVTTSIDEKGRCVLAADGQKWLLVLSPRV